MGDIEPVKQRNGPSRLLGDHEQLLILQAVGKDSRGFGKCLMILLLYCQLYFHVTNISAFL